MKRENALHAHISAFVDELSSAGMRHACVSPGSRSTPLAMLLAAHPAIRVWMHLDERSCAYFALGMAKQSGTPVGLLCTSGTAATNFLPAVVEAFHARVPMVVLTADRPAELQNVGANQTIDQVELYGKQVKWFCQVPLADSSPQALRYVRLLASRSMSTSRAQPQGPVHLNFPFREPLIPIPQEAAAVDRVQGQKNSPRVCVGPSQLDDVAVDALASDLVRAGSGLIICGPQTGSRFPYAVADLARSLHFPILADPLSQVRCGLHDRSLVVDTYDSFLRNQEVADSLAVDIILRFGGMPRSKPLAEYLQRQSCRQIVVSPSPPAADPTLTATEIIYAQPSCFCRALSESAGLSNATQSSGPTPDVLASHWLRRNDGTRAAISKCFTSLSELFEGKVFTELEGLLPSEAILFVGNSMPVRDLETFFPSCDKEIRFHANHGVSGIDGVTSAALGVASLEDLPAFLVTGDLSFYHDLTGLLAAKLHEINLTVVLLNNNGGGIFSFLPQAIHSPQFETLFGTPHGLSFQPIVEAFGGTYQRIDHWDDFRVSFVTPSTGLRVFEIRTDRNRNVELHHEIWGAVSSSLEVQAVS